ncbi:crossover junction endodeoxyribonuclease RuvC [Bartonella sp. DGB2]|uniref:crossover junction endodeoxyribonuclease RuvC n=1 Tax=Bartonella sp. DGB2 TaxID=3388426 RepID=UPI00398FA74C
MEKFKPNSVIKDFLTTPVRRNSRQTEKDQLLVRAENAQTTQPILLALDLGTTTGWALCNQNGRIISGTAHFRPRRFEGGGMRYLRFERWLNGTHSVCDGIEAIYFEEVRRHLGVDAAHAYGGLLASLTSWCEEQNIPYEGVPVGTIKKFITGKGNAGKSAVINAVRALGHRPEDDNEADALALLHHALAQHAQPKA